MCFRQTPSLAALPMVHGRWGTGKVRAPDFVLTSIEIWGVTSMGFRVWVSVNRERPIGPPCDESLDFGLSPMPCMHSGNRAGRFAGGCGCSLRQMLLALARGGPGGA